MADSLHLALSAFRDTMLTAVARLEFAIRDGSIGNTSIVESTNLDSTVTKQIAALGDSLNILSTTYARYGEEIKEIKKDVQAVISAQRAQESEQKETLNTVVRSIQEQVAALLKATEETKELLKIPAPSPSTTRNVLISTPALTAAVSAIAVQHQPPVMDLDDEEEEEAEVEQKDDEMSVEGEVEAEEEEDNSPDLRQVMIKGKQYFMDADNSVYVETDEGYEEIGTYNSALDCIEGAEKVEEEVEEEEEEGIEVEEFLYKGKTYQRDSENNVYEDGEQIGTWNGKKIIPLA